MFDLSYVVEEQFPFSLSVWHLIGGLIHDEQCVRRIHDNADTPKCKPESRLFHLKSDSTVEPNWRVQIRIHYPSRNHSPIIPTDSKGHPATFSQSRDRKSCYFQTKTTATESSTTFAVSSTGCAFVCSSANVNLPASNVSSSVEMNTPFKA